MGYATNAYAPTPDMRQQTCPYQRTSFIPDEVLLKHRSARRHFFEGDTNGSSRFLQQEEARTLPITRLALSA
ncbi:hypothetical protein [Bradyrhizobium sp. CCBAU 51745]|uniref:hypothetical protein n=1 Tax=Bradyrhizobium sp. CCBAU 51745 TaxID=1325099 RepID=UPI0023055FD4|nr:hypothetical protein [Bradyrhizobium sp. CCBAU 51745]